MSKLGSILGYVFITTRVTFIPKRTNVEYHPLCFTGACNILILCMGAEATSRDSVNQVRHGALNPGTDKSHLMIDLSNLSVLGTLTTALTASKSSQHTKVAVCMGDFSSSTRWTSAEQHISMHGIMLAKNRLQPATHAHFGYQIAGLSREYKHSTAV